MIVLTVVNAISPINKSTALVVTANDPRFGISGFLLVEFVIHRPRSWPWLFGGPIKDKSVVPKW